MTIKTYLNFFVFLLFLLTSKTLAFAQSEEDVDGEVTQQIWLDMYPHLVLGEKWHYIGDFGFRKIVDENSWAQLFMRPAIKYQYSDILSFQISMSVAYDWSRLNEDHLLITPRQGVRIDWPSFGPLNFYHLLRLEERISYKVSDWSHTVDLIGRYKIFGDYTFKLNERGRFWFISFYAEVFHNPNKKVEFNKNKFRTGIGLGYDPSNDWKYIFMLNWQGSQTSEDQTQISDMIFQLKIYKTLRKWSKYLN
ncbi:MAG: DUF2490 domain-containing protein [Reichenbachiella sp.]|uniref:DUF2490 domain-containing protein n=1 Tax=Reichenbachiella sp. TaxID=2184521 RepID=UPI0032987ECB